MTRPAHADLTTALSALGLSDPRPVLVLVGGAANIDPTVAATLLALFETLAPTLDALGVVVIDGGTAFGVMALMGEARQRTAARFPLIGVAATGTIAPATVPIAAQVGVLSGDEQWIHSVTSGEAVPLDPHHSHFLLTPGDQWGDEAKWIDATAARLAAGSPALTLVAAGGQITRLDVAISLKAGRRLIVLAGTGGTADLLANWWRGGDPIENMPLGTRERGLIQVVDLATAAVDLPLLFTQVFAASAE